MKNELMYFFAKLYVKYDDVLRKFSRFCGRYISWRLPVLIWPGEEVDVSVHFDCTKFNLEDLFKIEKILLKNCVYFDTGGGCNGRDWEMDWSLHGPIKIYFSGHKQKIAKKLEKQMVKEKRKIEIRKLAVFNPTKCGCASCAECEKHIVGKPCKALGFELCTPQLKDTDDCMEVGKQ